MNERYKGDCLLQKTYSDDFINKRIKRNTGELPQYYVKNSHPAIIERNVFDKVQEKMKKIMPKVRQKSFLSGKLLCANCGGVFGPKVWHSNSSYKSKIWRCNNKYKKRGVICNPTSVREPEVIEVFMSVVKNLEKNRMDIVEALKNKLKPKEVVLSEFNEDLWFALIDRVYADSDGRLRFLLWEGTEIQV